MTHIASSLNAMPIEHRQNPAGLTAKAITHSNSGLACREEYDACTSVYGNEFASEATPRPQVVEGHQITTWQILKLYALCAALGFGVMAIVHAKRTADLNANWEMINDR